MSSGRWGAGEEESRKGAGRRNGAIMRSGVYRGTVFRSPQLRVREYERLEESRTKVCDLSED